MAAEKAGREGMKRPAAQKVMRYIMKNTPGPLLYPIFTAIVTSSTGSTAPLGPRSENRPAGLYHTMVRMIAGYTVRGVIWYQGESDDPKAELYPRLFSALIRCWRDAWGDELPFLFVQLAPFEHWLGLPAVNTPILREQQAAVATRWPAPTWPASWMPDRSWISIPSTSARWANAWRCSPGARSTARTFYAKRRKRPARSWKTGAWLFRSPTQEKA